MHTPMNQHGHLSQVWKDSVAERRLSQLHQSKPDEARPPLPIQRATNSVRLPVHFVNSAFVPVIRCFAN
jgi:hypothetical protein